MLQAVLQILWKTSDVACVVKCTVCGKLHNKNCDPKGSVAIRKRS